MKSARIVAGVIIIILSIIIMWVSNKPLINNSADQLALLDDEPEIISLFSHNTQLKTEELLEKFESLKNFYCEYEIKLETDAIVPINSLPSPGEYKLWFKDGKIKTNYKVSEADCFYIYNPENDVAYLYNISENSAIKFSLDTATYAAMPIRRDELNPFGKIKEHAPKLTNNGTSVINNLPCDVLNYEDENIKVTYYFLEQTKLPIKAEVRSGTPGQIFRYSIVFKSFKTDSVSNSDVSVPTSVRVGLLSQIP